VVEWWGKHRENKGTERFSVLGWKPSLRFLLSLKKYTYSDRGDPARRKGGMPDLREIKCPRRRDERAKEKLKFEETRFSILGEVGTEVLSTNHRSIEYQPPKY